MRVDFKACVGWKQGDANLRPAIGVYSVGSKAKTSTDRQFAQFEFDVSHFRDPTGQKQFRGKSGLAPEVQTWVKDDVRVPGLIQNCLILADDLVKPKANTEGDTTRMAAASQWLSFSFKDHHGIWAAPAIAELVANALSDAGYTVAVLHRELKEIETTV